MAPTEPVDPMEKMDPELPIDRIDPALPTENRDAAEATEAAAEEAAANAKTTVAVGENIATRMNLANEKERIAILKELDELQDAHVKRCKQCTAFGAPDPNCVNVLKLIQRTDKLADRIM